MNFAVYIYIYIYSYIYIYIYSYIYTLYNIRIILKTNFNLIATTTRYLGKGPETSHRLNANSVLQYLPYLKARHTREEIPGKAVCWAVYSCVRRSFRGNLATQCLKNTCHLVIFLATRALFLTVSGQRVEIKKALSQSLQSPLVFYPYF